MPKAASSIRPLTRGEIKEIWTIDRRETYHRIYRLENGGLIRTPAYFEMPGWPEEQVAHDGPWLTACFDRGGIFLGVFEGDRLHGVAVLDSTLFGPQSRWLQLKYLYISQDRRGQGIGARLFQEAQAAARSRNAQFLYISATPTENTVDFYIRRGCRLAEPPDPYLLALEPDDIHLICPV